MTATSQVIYTYLNHRVTSTSRRIHQNIISLQPNNPLNDFSTWLIHRIELNNISNVDTPPSSIRVINNDIVSKDLERWQHGWTPCEGPAVEICIEKVAEEEGVYGGSEETECMAERTETPQERDWHYFICSSKVDRLLSLTES
jgi:hypothetical protein